MRGASVELVRRCRAAALGWVRGRRLSPVDRRSVELWATGSWLSTTWLGFPVAQLPQDLVVLQEIVVETRPEVIVETGLLRGGSAMFYASILELCGIDGEVISVESDPDPSVVERLASHPVGRRVRVVRGDSSASSSVAQVAALLAGRRCGLVSLDSDHSCEHVAAELEAYSPMVTVGGHVCVLDGIEAAIARSGVRPGLGESPRWLHDNPLSAVRDFLSRHPEFSVSERNRQLGATFAPSGFLQRVR